MIEIQTRMPHGNAALTSIQVEDGVLAVHFAADPHGGTESLWWCFRLTNCGIVSDETLRVVWDHPGNCLGLGERSAQKLNPVMRQEGEQWARLPSGQVHEHSDGRASAVWEIRAPQTWCELAFCFPHGPDEIDALVRDAAGRLNSDIIGVSAAGRPLVRISNDPGCEWEDRRRPGVYCVGHQHASEMSGGWVLDGFLRRIGDRTDAPVVWSVPMANVDGIIAGDYGKDPFPWDLNRAWGHPPMRAEVAAIMRDMQRWQHRTRPSLALDFHSPGGAEDFGVYAFVPDPQTRAEASAVTAPWIERIRSGLGDWAAEDFGRVARYPGRFKTDQHASFSRFCQDLSLPSLVLETPYHRIGGHVLSIADYQAIGAQIANAVCDALR